MSERFRPSTHGLHFDNRWPRGTPVLLGMGDAADGLCGGMVFTAADLWHAGRTPPTDTTPPARGTPLFRRIARRQWDSLHVPGGVLAYYIWAVAADPRAARRTARIHLPRVTAALDRVLPVPLGLVTVRSLNPLRLARCHQVLAYAAAAPDPTGAVTLRVYDPNQHDDDTVTITVADDGAIVGSTVDSDPIRGFFHLVYHPDRRRDDTVP